MEMDFVPDSWAVVVEILVRRLAVLDDNLKKGILELKPRFPQTNSAHTHIVMLLLLLLLLYRISGSTYVHLRLLRL
jgi:hypothetical protein